MSLIKTEGITVYYIDFKLAKNKAMAIKTIAHNKRAYVQQLNIHERINLKSAYGLIETPLFEKLHLINMVFAEQPYHNRF
ncbi:hypothetical protein [Hymenobacter ruber]